MEKLTPKTQENYKKMLDYQEEIKPFVPTLRELMIVWNVGSMGAVTHHIDSMLAAGLLLTRQRGNSKSYYAVRK